MDMKKSLPLIVAATLGVGAFIAARQFAGPARPADPSAEVKWVEMPAAARDIEPGHLLEEKDLVALKVDERVMGGAVVPLATQLIGRVTSGPVGKGSLFTSSMLAPDGSTPGLAGVLKPGQRAITLEINEFTGMVNFMQPGSRVDVIARVQFESELNSRTIAQNVLVLAVGPRIAPQQKEQSALAGDAAAQQQQQVAMSRSVTLLVTPEQAELLDLAAANNFRLSLRAGNDSQEASLAGATLKDILGDLHPNNRNARARRDRDAIRNASTDPFSEPSKSRPVVAPVTATPQEPTFHNVRVIRNGAAEEVSVEMPKKEENSSLLTSVSDLLKGLGD